MDGLHYLVSTRAAADLFVLIFLKGSAVLLAVTLAAGLLRTRSAALRHRAWTVGLVALLLLPLLGPVLPRWSPDGRTLPYPSETPLLGLEALETYSAVGPPVTPGGLVSGQAIRRFESDQAARRSESGRHPAQGAKSGGTGRPDGALPPATLLLLAWWMGALIAGVRVFSDLARTAVLRLASRRLGPGDERFRRFDLERRRLGIRRRVDLLAVPIPGLAATMGALRPAVLLGPDVLEMPADELQPVLIHELAHVRRGDFLLHLLTNLAMPLFWPNPLFWWARRRAALEREQACDDEVLNRGIASSLYARILLAFEVARPSLSPALRSSVGFLRFSATKGRLQSILETGLDRRPLGRLAKPIGLVALMAISLPVASLDLLASAPGTGSTAELVTALDHGDPEVRARAARTLARRDASAVRMELEALLSDPDSDVRLAAMGGLEQLADPASLPIIARVLERPHDGGRGEHGFVLKLAMLTLGHLDSEPAFRVLEEQLDRPVAPLRWLALEMILTMPSHRKLAKPYLERFAESDPSERNRRLAREALAELAGGR